MVEVICVALSMSLPVVPSTSAAALLLQQDICISSPMCAAALRSSNEGHIAVCDTPFMGHCKNSVCGVWHFTFKFI